MNDSYIDDRKLHEECGVFGAYDFDCGDIASTIYYGLFALQHRGQESCGIAVSDTEGPKGKVLSHKDMGLVNEVFNSENLEKLKGNIGVGHVRYSTAGSSTRENAQPLGEDEYFVLGDNRNHSQDSRDPSVGEVKKDTIMGKAWVRIYPFDKMGVIRHE